jgi:AraC family transcriptional regulator of adaptative response / DNA-3-methyladenine glycosylase II
LPQCGDHVSAVFGSSTAAEGAGFVACPDCRPERIEWSLSGELPELAGRAIQLVLQGKLDSGTEPELARDLGVSGRHLRRLFNTYIGVTPDQLARSRRTHFARRLFDDTNLTMTDIASTAGFGSVRQFNRKMQQVFGHRHPPSGPRTARRPTRPVAGWTFA